MLQFHSDTFFGLAKSDAKMHDIETWKPSNKNKIKRHAIFMRTLVNTVQETDGLDDIDLDLDVAGVCGLYYLLSFICCVYVTLLVVTLD
jgi:hypothetical protein